MWSLYYFRRIVKNKDRSKHCMHTSNMKPVDITKYDGNTQHVRNVILNPITLQYVCNSGLGKAILWLYRYTRYDKTNYEICECF